MISDSKKFIFIHIPKTAGKSIEAALKKYINKSDMMGPHSSNVQVVYWYNQFNKINKPWDYYVFTVVRNPWERILSMVFYKSLNSPDPENCWTTKAGQNCFRGMVYDCSIDKTLPLSSPQYRSQSWYLHNHENLEINRIMRFENLQEDFDLVCDEIGISRRELPMVNVSKHKHYRELYTVEQRKLVQEACAKEIDRFGFKF